jgi:hypothetical protein
VDVDLINDGVVLCGSGHDVGCLGLNRGAGNLPLKWDRKERWTYSDIEAMRWNVNDSSVHHEQRVYTEYLHSVR